MEFKQWLKEALVLVTEARFESATRHLNALQAAKDTGAIGTSLEETLALVAYVANNDVKPYVRDRCVSMLVKALKQEVIACVSETSRSTSPEG